MFVRKRTLVKNPKVIEILYTSFAFCSKVDLVRWLYYSTKAACAVKESERDQCIENVPILLSFGQFWLCFSDSS